jgi:hypothetical protein
MRLKLVNMWLGTGVAGVDELHEILFARLHNGSFFFFFLRGCDDFGAILQGCVESQLV